MSFKSQSLLPADKPQVQSANSLKPISSLDWRDGVIGELPVGTVVLAAPRFPDRVWEVDINNRKADNLDIKVKILAGPAPGQPSSGHGLGLRLFKQGQHQTPFLPNSGNLLGLRGGFTHLGPTSPESSGD